MHFAAQVPVINDDAIPDMLALTMDPNTNWLHTRITPNNILDSSSTRLDQLKLMHVNIRRVVEKIDQ